MSLLALAVGLTILCSAQAFSAPPPPPPDTAAVGRPPHGGPPRSAPPPMCPALEPALFAAHYRAVATFTADSIPHEYVAVGNARGFVYVIRWMGFGYASSWSTFYLGAPAKKVVAEDIDADGVVDLVILTSAGKMFVFDTFTRQITWESTPNEFENASEFLIDQIDSDRARELILCADSRLLVLDGEKLQREYQSADEYRAEYMVIGDVDDDDEKELVLDSGFVINAKTLNMEWQTDFFGTRLTLFDVDDDGVPELVCESTGGALRVYDLDIRQEKTAF